VVILSTTLWRTLFKSCLYLHKVERLRGNFVCLFAHFVLNWTRETESLNVRYDAQETLLCDLLKATWIKNIHISHSVDINFILQYQLLRELFFPSNYTHNCVGATYLPARVAFTASHTQLDWVILIHKVRNIFWNSVQIYIDTISETLDASYCFICPISLAR
jgi:hypothetical protein